MYGFIGICGFLLLCIVCFALVTLVRNIISLTRRLSTVSKLKHVAKSNGASYTQVHSAWKPFFKSYAGADIVIQEKNGKKYCIKFLPFFTDGKFVSIYKDERKNTMKMRVTHRFSLATTYSEGRRRLKAPDGDATVSVSGLSVKRKLNLNMDNEASTEVCNIILYSKKSHQVSFVEQNHTVVVDNGVEYYGIANFYNDSIISTKMADWLNEDKSKEKE